MGGVNCIDARKKEFKNAVLACVLMRKNLPAHSVTKIPLATTQKTNIDIFIAMITSHLIQKFVMLQGVF
jgi:hypothetical protein